MDTAFYVISTDVCFLVNWVPGWGPEQRESGKTVLYVLIIIFTSIGYIIMIYYY